MGIQLEYLDIIHACGQRLTQKRAARVLGSQDCRFTSREANRWLARHKLPRIDERTWDRKPAELLRCMGFDDVEDIDVNSHASIHLDLSAPLPEAHRSSADLVIDSGTLEHIFDVKSGLLTMNQLLRPGGIILHLSPSGFFEHGFVNFNPRFFRRFYENNSYESVLTGYHLPIYGPTALLRSTTPRALTRLNILSSDQERPSFAAKMLRRVMTRVGLPNRIITVAAYRRPTGAEVATRVPLDIED